MSPLNQYNFDAIFEDPALLQAAKLLCLADFKTYIQIVFYAANRKPFTFKPFHDTIISKLQGIADGTAPKRNLMLNLPVGSGKSLLVELFITWCFARNINCKFCYVSHSDRLINKLSQETKEFIEMPEWTKLFGHTIKKDERAKAQYSFDGAGSRSGLTSAPIGGAITGIDAGNPNISDGFGGALIIDDPLDAGDANSELSKSESIRIYNDKLKTRLRTAKTPVIVIAQRIAIDDLCSWIEEHEADEYDIVKVKAYSEEEGSYWPERISTAALKKMQFENETLFAAQYQQEPMLEGGNIFKKDMFATSEMPNFDYTYITADTAYKEKQENDFTVFIHWGVYSDCLYLNDILIARIKSSEIEDFALPFVSKYNNSMGFRGCYIEPKGHGIFLNQKWPISGIVMPSEDELKEFFKDRRLDKSERAASILPFLAHNKIYINPAISEDIRDRIISEALNFPKAKHDDIVDCIIDGCKYIQTHRTSILDVL